MRKLAKRGFCILLALILALPLNLMSVLAAETSETETIKSNVTDSAQLNYFQYTAYSGKSWTLNADESYIDLGSSDSRANECFYEVHFRGNAIKMYAIKGPAHGKVTFTVDGEHSQLVDLYHGSRVTQKIYEVTGLEETDHVLKAVTMSEKTGSKVVNQICYAEVTHLPYTGGVPDLGGTIENTNTQYTQDRYGEISAKNVTTQNLTAWKNDKATSELVLYSRNCDLKNVSVTAGDLRSGDKVISAENVKTTFIKSTKAYNGAYLGYGSKTREVPAENGSNRSESSDILYQTTPIDMGYNKLQPVWVEFNIPKDAEAGIYTGTLTATADGLAAPLTFTYKVTVQNAVLPDIDELAGNFDLELWQYPYSSAEYYNVEPFSEEHKKIMESSMLKYKEAGGHAITATILEEAWSGQTYSANEVHYPSMVKWTKNSDGSFSYDYTDFDAWVEFCKSLGIGDKIVLYSIAPWHNSFTYWENGQLKYEAFTAGSERYNTVWTNFLTDLIAHLEEKGWFDETYMGIDERGFNAHAFDTIESVKNSEGVSLKTAGAMDAYINKKDLGMRVNDLNVADTAAQEHPAEFAQFLAERNEKGLRTTLYTCTQHLPGNFSLSQPMESYWTVVNARKAGTSGLLRWAYDAWVADPLNDATHNAFEPGDCFLIYPAEKDAADKTCKSSVRLERMAEGIRDVNKLIFIEKEMPELADEIAALYAGIQTTARTGSGSAYLNNAQKTQLESDMNAFKAGVAAITERYIAATKDGLHIAESQKELEEDQTWKIGAILKTDKEDKSIVYKTADASIAAVDAKGVVTARKPGTTVITAMNWATGYQAQVEITVVKKPMYMRNMLTDYKLPEEYLSDIEKDPENAKGRRYLGQPDMVMLDDEQTLITVYPSGHGKGSVVMQISRDAGETWTEKTDTPSSWRNSHETPTLYKLKMTNGDTKLIMISGRPASFGAPTGGWDTSLSTDNGETWTEYKTHCEYFADGTTRNDTVVAMASLIQMKENGQYIDKWMGVYHDGGTFVNYKTYLTFDENGNDVWTTPVPYLSEHRAVESRYAICEVGLFRSPDGNRIVGLARNQNHDGWSTMFYSDDEGETWSEPKPVPGSLAGERHKAMYDPTDPTGQRLIITFREICYDLNGNNQHDGNNDWVAGDWIAWVGTYDDIMEGNQGQYRILLCEDWAHNAKSGDTGYSGLVVKADGTYIIDTYGHWDKDYWVEHNGNAAYNVYNDLCYIKQAKFKLSDLDSQISADIKADIQKEIADAPVKEESYKYTQESWDAYESALNAAQNVLNSSSSTQDECYAALETLEETKMNLVMVEKVPVAEVRLDQTGVTLTEENASAVLQVSFLPEYASDKSVTFTSSAPEIVRVDAQGKVTGIKSGTAVITVTTNDGAKTAECKVTVDFKNGGALDDQAAVFAGLKKELQTADALIAAGQKNYTDDTWSAFVNAYNEAKKADGNTGVLRLKTLLKNLENARANLKLKAVNPQPVNPDPEAPVKEGTVIKRGNYRYKITSLSKHTVTVTGIEPDKLSKIKKVKISGTVNFGGQRFAVTEIGASAFKNNKKITSAVIGKNVKTIGNNAFAGCKNLKKVTLKGNKLSKIGKKAFAGDKKLKQIIIKSKNLKKVGANAFKGINKKAIIRVPAAKYKKYVKTLARKGQSKGVKIKK